MELGKENKDSIRFTESGDLLQLVLFFLGAKLYVFFTLYLQAHIRFHHLIYVHNETIKHSYWYWKTYGNFQRNCLPPGRVGIYAVLEALQLVHGVVADLLWFHVSHLRRRHFFGSR